MADISAIKLPNNTTYNIKDATARNNLLFKQNEILNATYIDGITMIMSVENGMDMLSGVIDSIAKCDNGIGDEAAHSYDVDDLILVWVPMLNSQGEPIEDRWRCQVYRAKTAITAGDVLSSSNVEEVKLTDHIKNVYWKGTTDEWSNLSASEKAKYDGKAVIFTDDAGDYTGMPQPYSFTITGSGSYVTTTFNHASITENMRVIEAIVETPSAILSDISITTANGSLTVSAAVNGSSVVKVLMQPCKAEIALT